MLVSLASSSWREYLSALETCQYAILFECSLTEQEIRENMTRCRTGREIAIWKLLRFKYRAAHPEYTEMRLWYHKARICFFRNGLNFMVPLKKKYQKIPDNFDCYKPRTAFS